MWGLVRWHLLIGLAAILCILCVSWLALAYYIPAPPSKITIATGVKGGAYELLGNRYKAILARSHVTVDVRVTEGAGENLNLLQDKNANVQAAFVGGGVSNALLSPDLLSLGRISYQPFWVFYRSAEIWPDLTSMRGKRIAAGPPGSDTRMVAEGLLHISGIDLEAEALSPIFGLPAVKALAAGQIDAAFIGGGPDSSIVQKLLRNPDVRLLNFPRAEALTKIYPFLVRLVLPAGVIDFAANNPPADVNLLGTTNALLVRKDLHPQIIYLLAQALMEVHGEAGLFQRAGEFPTQTDPEYPMSESARDFYRSGPGLLNRYLPFWVTNYLQRAIAILIAAIAIMLPVFRFLPQLYSWLVHQRLRKLYRRLRLVETALREEITIAQAEALESDLGDIDREASVVPMRDSDLFFIFWHHLDRTRSRVASRLAEARNQTAKPLRR
jgi:TRAP transporter TAXI family solute receptor